jgi:hypothetical protein
MQSNALFSYECRLPHEEDLTSSLVADDSAYGTQYVVGIQRTYDDLYLSYGDMDCQAQASAFVM